MPNPTYLDYNATTPLDPRIQGLILSTLTHLFGNPSSSTHSYGWKADSLLRIAREQVALLIDASPKQIIFNSGATESNNTIFRAIFEAFREKGCHIITSEIEHKCILKCSKYLEKLGCKITYLPVDTAGRIQVERIPEFITSETRLISVMGANNETGVLQDLHQVVKIAKHYKIPCHSDIAQVCGKIPFSVRDLAFDFLSFSSHKLYGPKGAGGIYTPHIYFLKKFPLIYGGDQEQSTRAGTINIPSIAGFGAAAELAKAELPLEAAHLRNLKHHFFQSLKTKIPEIVLNGKLEETLPGVVNFYIPELLSKDFLAWAKEELALSTGSACTSVNQEPSHVLKAMQLSDEACKSSLRLSFGRFTKVEDLDKAVEVISAGYQLLTKKERRKAI